MFFKKKEKNNNNKKKFIFWTIKKKDFGSDKNFSLDDLIEFSQKNGALVIVEKTCVVHNGIFNNIH